MKQKIKINEAQLRSIIRESVEKMLNGNTYRGVPGTRVISDWELDHTLIEYNGNIYNELDVESALRDAFVEQTHWNYQDYRNPECEAEFNRFCQKNAPSVLMNMEPDDMYQTNPLDDPSFPMNESELDEYQFGNFTKRVGTGLWTFLGKKGSLQKKFQNAKANFMAQGELNDLNELLSKLQKFVDMKVLSPNTTIAELIGNKQLRKGDKQGIKQRAGSLRGNIKNRGGQWH